MTRAHQITIDILSIISGHQRVSLGVIEPRGRALASRIFEDTMSWAWFWIEAQAKTFLRLMKSHEHFQINDADFAVFQFSLRLRYLQCALNHDKL